MTGKTTIRTETKTHFAEFALLVSDPDTADSFVHGYTPGTTSTDAAHRWMFAHALKALAHEDIDPTDCVFEVMTPCLELDPPYWKAAAHFNYSEALEVIAGTRQVVLDVPAEDFPPPQGEATPDNGHSHKVCNGVSEHLYDVHTVTMTPEQARKFIEQLNGTAN